MGEDILKEAQQRMEKTVDVTKERFAAIRAGRANVAMLDGIMVSYYGNQTPLKQVANLSAPEARTLVIEPWDKSLIKEIEKGIQQANIGLTPNNDGKIVRLTIPELTKDRRKEYVKLAKKETEEGKVGVRNIRKDANNKLRKLEKDSEISSDDLKLFEGRVQTETDKYIKKIEELYLKKEKEITTV